MSVIRTFIALPASPSVQQSIVTVQSQLQEAQATVKWDTPEQFHITLKFLGDVETNRIDSLAKALHHTLDSFNQFDITYAGIGAFPDLENPRIVWIGIQNNHAILTIQQAVEQMCEELGFPKETRAFHPHITLGRVRGINNIHRLTEAIKTGIFEPIQVHCPEVLLMKSDLHPDGAIYMKLESFLLHI
jgi:RNA 2',3'-cyclic 3'-phosphodiesterase